MPAVDNLALTAVVAIAVSMVLRSRGRSTALPLLALGILVGLMPWGPSAPDSPEMIQTLVLAPLVFGEALSSSVIDITKVKRPVIYLAVGLVAATTLVVGGVVMAVVVAIPAAMAFAIGAILAPTDAVAVANVAKRANLPRTLVSILEGESLVNDGTGLTALRVATAAAVAGSVTMLEAGGILAQSVLIGVGVGVASGMLLVLIIRHSDDVVAVGGVLLVAPFPIYLLTEEIDGSAILAIVIAALMASHASHSDPSYRGRVAVSTVWRQITFILQGVAFLLLGLELPAAIRLLDSGDLTLLPITVLVVVAALIGTRVACVMSNFGWNKLRSQEDIGTWQNWLIVSWAGARGPVSALAAFSIPLVTSEGSELPYRDFVVAVALCVVAVTLLVSPTLAPLAKFLDIEGEDTSGTERWVRTSMARASLSALESADADAERSGNPLPKEMVRTLRHQAERRLDVMDSGITAQESDRVKLGREVTLAMAEAEQRELLRLRSEEGVPDAIVRPLLTDVDRRIATIRSTRLPPTPT